MKETGTGPDWSSSIIQDFLTLSFLICFVFLCYYPLLTTAVITGNYKLIKIKIISLTSQGLFLGMSNNCSHNWFHLGDRKAKWRRFYFDLSLVGHREWRVSIWVSSFPYILETWIITTLNSQISHALSHHLLTNTYADLEVSSVEPLLQYLPVPMVRWAHIYIWPPD